MMMMVMFSKIGFVLRRRWSCSNKPERVHVPNITPSSSSSSMSIKEHYDRCVQVHRELAWEACKTKGLDEDETNKLCAHIREQKDRIQSTTVTMMHHWGLQWHNSFIWLNWWCFVKRGSHPAQRSRYSKQRWTSACARTYKQSLPACLPRSDGSHPAANSASLEKDRILLSDWMLI